MQAMLACSQSLNGFPTLETGTAEPDTDVDEPEAPDATVRWILFGRPSDVLAYEVREKGS